MYKLWDIMYMVNKTRYTYSQLCIVHNPMVKTIYNYQYLNGIPWMWEWFLMVNPWPFGLVMAVPCKHRLSDAKYFCFFNHSLKLVILYNTLETGNHIGIPHEIYIYIYMFKPHLTHIILHDVMWNCFQDIPLHWDI